MVDSMPTGQAPPSSTGSDSPNSDATWLAVVGLTRPKRFALGAATPGTPSAAAARSSAWPPGGPGSAGRCACPPAAAVATPGARRHDQGHGPGQNAAIRRSATGRAPQRTCGRRRSAHVHDQRMVGRAALGGEDPATAASRPRVRPGHRRSRSERPPVRRRASRRAARSARRRGRAGGQRGSERLDAQPGRGACSASRAGRHRRPVTVRWPILRPRRGSVLPYRCRCTPGSASTRARGARRRGRRRATTGRRAD